MPALSKIYIYKLYWDYSIENIVYFKKFIYGEFLKIFKINDEFISN